MDTPQETNIRAAAAKRAWDAIVLVIQRLQGVSDGLGPYWDSGELNQLLELARIAAWVAGCRNLGQSLLMISRELPEEQNACQASGAVEQLAPLAERARVLALRLNPHLG